MKAIRIILQNIKPKTLTLWFSMAVVFIAILNVSSVEAKSLKNGEEFEANDGSVIRVISSDEVEIDRRDGIFLGKYTVNGERVRIVTSFLGTAVVTYYKITPDGLVEEKEGRIFYSNAGSAGRNQIGVFTEPSDRILKQANEEEQKAAIAAMARKFKDNGNRTVKDGTGFFWVKAIRTTPVAFDEKVREMREKYTIRKGKAITGDDDVIAPPPGSDVYLAGMMWQWRPILELKKGQTYRLHISSFDVGHGFSLQPENINFQVYPGIEMVFNVTPNKSGQFSIACNLYCGGIREMGHHTMLGRIYIKE